MTKQALLLGFCLFRSVMTSAQTDPFRRLADNAEFEWNSAIVGHLNRGGLSYGHYDNAALFTRLTVKSQTRFTEAIHAGFELYGAYTSQGDVYQDAFSSPGDKSKRQPWLDFNTAWLRYKAANFEIKAGKDYLKNGLSEIFSPVDRFGRYNFADLTQIYPVGVWQAGLDYFIADDTLSLKILPVPDRYFLPSFYSQSLGVANAIQPPNVPIEEKIPSVALENAGYLLQYKGSRAGYDFFGLLHHGPSIYPVLHYDNRTGNTLKIEPLATSISAGVLKVVEEWKLFAEAIYQHADSSREENFIRYSTGLSYTDSEWANTLGFNQIIATVQWSGDETTHRAESGGGNATWVSVPLFAALAPLPSFNPRPLSNALLTKVEIEHNSEWSYVFSSAHAPAGGFGFLTGVGYKPTDNLGFDVESCYFEGHEQSSFDASPNRDAFFSLHTVYKF